MKKIVIVVPVRIMVAMMAKIVLDMVIQMTSVDGDSDSDKDDM